MRKWNFNNLVFQGVLQGFNLALNSPIETPALALLARLQARAGKGGNMGMQYTKPEGRSNMGTLS